MTWTHHGDNYWTGPEAVILTTEPHNPISVASMWTPEDGLRITVDAGDHLLTATQSAQLANILTDFAHLDTPEGKNK